MILLPNVLIMGAIFFGLGALTRRMLPVYVAGVVVLIGNFIARSFLQDIDNKTLAALVDPTGSVAQGVVTRYWSPLEKNTQLVPLAGELLWNRALWGAVGLAVFVLCYALFRMRYAQGEGRKKRKVAVMAEDATPAVRRAASRALPDAALDVRARTYLRQLPGLVALYLRETVKNVYFVVIVLAGAGFILANAKTAGTIFGTPTYPVTYQVLDFASGTFGLFMLIITAFYAGELVWRERDARMALIADSLPTPSWLPFIAKLATLMATQALLQLVVLVCGVLVQLFMGYTKLELGQYLFRLFVLQLPDYWMIAALALTVHTLVNHKYLGHFVVVLYFIVQASLPRGFGYDHMLYHFGAVPPVVYSDMNGYGHFLGPVRWFQLYWAAASVLLLVAARLFWVRGTDTGWRMRLRIAGQRWTRPVVATTVAAALVFVATGAWIYYNTDVLNPYRTEFARGELVAQYEKLYKPLAAKPQPKVTAVRVDVDIFPHQHHIRFAGTYTLKNKGDVAIPELYLNLRESAKVNKLAGSVPMKLAESRPELDWRRYTLDPPLAPGATMTLDFDLEYPPPGFTNAGAHAMVVDNGTFVNSFSTLPIIGYQERKELVQDHDRREARAEAQGAHARPRRRRGAPLQLHLARRRLDRLRRHGDDFRRPDRARARLPAARVDRGRPAPFPLQDGRADPQLLRVPLRALRREARRVARWRQGRADRDLLPARARVRPRPDDRGREGFARLLHEELQPLPAPPGADPRVPALRALRAVVPEHHPVLGGDRLHRQGRPEGSQGHRLSVLRHGPRGGAPVVGAPGDRRRRAGRHDDCPRRSPSTRRSW